MKNGVLLALALTYVLSVYPAFGDAGYDEVIYGAARSEEEHPTVSMAAETVDVEIQREGVSVAAEFTFVNNGPEADVPMYLPYVSGIAMLGVYHEFIYVNEGSEVRKKDIYADDWRESETGEIVLVDARESDWRTTDAAEFFAPAEDNYYILKSFVKSFKVETHGEPVKTEIVSRVVGKDSRIFGRWTVSFGEGEEKTVRCEYYQPYHYGQTALTPGFEYVLYTGRSWAGAIGEGTITVRRPLDLGYAIMFTSPGNLLELEGPAEEYSPEEKFGLVPYVSWNGVPSIPAGKIVTAAAEEKVVWEFEDYEPGPNDEIRVLVGGRTPSGLIYGFGDWVYSEILDYFLTELGLPAGGVPGVATGTGLNLRAEPSLDAERVAGREKLGYKTPFSLLESRGEWWRVRLADGHEGWIRWRYVDPDTGEEFVYASFVAPSNTRWD